MVIRRKKKRKNWKAYHLIERKTGDVKRYWVYGDSPSEIRKRLGGYNQKELALIPTKRYGTTKSIKSYLRQSKISKKNLVKARKKKR